MPDDLRRIYASDSGTFSDGGTVAYPTLRRVVPAGSAAQTWDVQLLTEAEATPQSRREAATDLAAFAGGGYVADVLGQIMGHRTALGSIIGGCIAVWYLRRGR